MTIASYGRALLNETIRLKLREVDDYLRHSFQQEQKLESRC
jgi:hypothetical protein